MKSKIILIIIAIVLVVGIVIFATRKDTSWTETSNVDLKDYKYFAIYSGENVGIVDNKGTQIIEPKYTDIYIPNPTKDIFICFEDTDSKVYNSKSERLYSDYDDVSALVTSESSILDFEKDVLKYRKDDLYGLISLDGEKITEPIYNEITSLENRPGRILVKKDEEYGVLDSKGNVVISMGYYLIKGDEFNTAKDGYTKTGYIVAEKTKSGIMYGYIDYNGKKVLDTKYDSISRIFEEDDSDVYLVVMKNGRKGVYKNGKKIIDEVYQEIMYSYLSKIFIVNKNNKFGFFARDGRQILPSLYEYYEVAGKYISIDDNGQRYLYDINGNLIEQKSYSSIIEVENTDYIIGIDNTDGTYSIISKEVNVKKGYVGISYLFDDYFAFTVDTGKSGILNAKTGEIVEAKYDLIIPVDGVNAVEAKLDDGTSVFYSREIQEIATFEYPIVERINDNFAQIYNDTDRIYLDKDGKVVDNTTVNPKQTIYSFKQDGLWGYKDASGKVLVEPKYDIATEVNEFGFGAVKSNGKWGVINSEGNVVVEPTYDLETYYYPRFIGEYLLEETETVHCVELED